MMPKLPEAVQALDMTAGIIVHVTPEDRRRLEAILLDRNAPPRIAARTYYSGGHCKTKLSGPTKGAGLRRSGCQLTPLGQGGRTVLLEDVAAV